MPPDEFDSRVKAMAEQETHLEMLQRRSQTVVRRRALTMLATQIVVDPTGLDSAGGSSLIIWDLKLNDRFVWDSKAEGYSHSRFDHNALSEFRIPGRFELIHSGATDPSASQYARPIHFVIRRGKVPVPTDLCEQMALLERAMLVLGEEADRIKKELMNGETAPGVL